MKNQISSIIAVKGYECIFNTIDKTIIDLKNLGDEPSEVRDFIFDKFGGFDDKLNEYLNTLKY